jgi:carboxyl-terminal processing protease
MNKWKKSVRVFITLMLALLLPGPSDAVGSTDLLDQNLSLFSEVITVIKEENFEEPDLRELFSAAVRGVKERESTEKDLDVGMISENYSIDTEEKLVEAFADVLEKHFPDAWNAGDAGEPARVVHAAIDEMLSTLDPEGQFYPPEDPEEETSSDDDENAATGVTLKKHEGSLVIVDMVPKSPASRSGINTGDRLIEVDGQSVENSELRDVIDLLRGKKDSRVTVKVARQGEGEPLEFTLKRKKISHKHKRIRRINVDRDIGYVMVKRLDWKTNPELTTIMANLRIMKADHYKGFILDFRNNSGGTLRSVVNVADNFLGEGTITVSRERDQDFYYIHYADKETQESGLPMVVLVNSGTASGGEMVAGALQHHRRVVVVGTGTSGNGSIWSYYKLGWGGYLSLVTSKLETPEGRPIQDNGIEPDFVVPSDSPVYGDKLLYQAIPEDTSDDPQLQKALEIIRDGTVSAMTGLAGDEDKGDTLPNEVADPADEAWKKYMKEDYDEAFKLFQRSAEKGNISSLYMVGRFYFKSETVETDYAEAAKWYRKAATVGSGRAQFALGLMHKLGIGVEQSHGEAMRWFVRAARNHYRGAEFYIGEIYYTGTQYPQDYGEAHRWFLKAAERHHNAAQFNLGVMYANGLGVQQDNLKAYMWVKVAEDNMNKSAKEMRILIEENMTKAEKKEGKKLAKQWRLDNRAGPVSRYSRFYEKALTPAPFLSGEMAVMMNQ